jgi:hypothetical protein
MDAPLRRTAQDLLRDQRRPTAVPMDVRRHPGRMRDLCRPTVAEAIRVGLPRPTAVATEDARRL